MIEISIRRLSVCVALLGLCTVVGCALDFESRPLSTGDNDVLGDSSDASSDAADVGDLGDVPVDTVDNPCGTACPRSQCCQGESDGFACVDLADDPLHCGGCGFACDSGLSCSNADCVCPEGTADCNDNLDDGCEVTLATDSANCGVCDVSCSQLASCQAGSCVCNTPGFVYCSEDQSCLAGNILTQCGTTCETLQFCDPNGNHVDAAACIDQVCVLTCDNSDRADCDQDPANGCEAELDKDDSEEHCGSCDNDCSPPGVPLNGSFDRCRRRQGNQECEYNCDPGWGDCDPLIAGCETSLQDDPNCGRCGTTCADLPNVEPGAFCERGAILGEPGVCQIDCSGSFKNCDQDPSDGCEQNVNSSTLHCGSCNRACGTGLTCSGGSCS